MSHPGRAPTETGTIAFLVGRQHVPVRDIQDDFYYYKVMEGIQGELRGSRLHLLFSYLDDDDGENRAIVAGLEGKVDGVLLAEAGSSTLVNDIHDRGLPCVLINPSIDDIDQRFDSLSVNNRSGAHKAIAYLIGLGHRRIGCAGPSPPSRRRTGSTGIFGRSRKKEFQATTDWWCSSTAGHHRTAPRGSAP